MIYIGCMNKITAVIFASFLVVAPLQVQAGDEDMREGLNLLEQGTRLLLEGLMSELGPALKNLEDMVIDLNAYHAPEVMPNGDIIIRRKLPVEQSENGEIDL